MCVSLCSITKKNDVERHVPGFRVLNGLVRGSGIKVQGSGFRVPGSGFKVQGLGCCGVKEFGGPGKGRFSQSA